MLYEPLMKFKDFNLQEQTKIISDIAVKIGNDYTIEDCIENARLSDFYRTSTGIKSFENSGNAVTLGVLQKIFTASAIEVIDNYYEIIRVDDDEMIFTGWAYDELFAFDIEGMIYQICEDYKSAVEQGEKEDWLNDRGIARHHMAAFEQAALSLGVCNSLGL